MEHKKVPHTLKLIISFLFIQTILIILFAIYIILQFYSIQSTLKETQSMIEERFLSVGQEMEEVLSQQTSLTTNFNYTLQPAPHGKVLLTLSADLKSYTNGSAVSFTVTPDQGETSLIKTNISNNTLSASTTLSVCDSIKVGLVVTDNQTTSSQSLAEIMNVKDFLTSHLYLTPDIVVKQEGSDLFLSGSYSLLNQFTLDTQRLDMVRLEITQNDLPVHTFYFSQDFQSDLPEHQDLHILLFERIKITPQRGFPIFLSVRARDKDGYEYFSTSQKIDVDSSGVASNIETLETEFHLS